MQEMTESLDKFRYFQRKLELTPEAFERLAPYRATFLRYEEEYATFFYDYLHEMEDTRRVLEYMSSRGGLEANWKRWWRGLFTTGFNEDFYRMLWRSGIRHVEASLDQRYINLGYCMARNFIHDIVDRDIPETDARPVLHTIDRMLDMCLMVATEAFLTHTTLCEREIINGIAHQVRNPLTIIGGFAKKLQTQSCDATRIEKLEAIFDQALRLEEVVRNASLYIELYQKQPEHGVCPLRELVVSVLGGLKTDEWPAGLEPVIELDEAHPAIWGDVIFLRMLFLQLFKNALEATALSEDPMLRITSAVEPDSPTFLTVRILNNGPIPRKEDIQNLFAPFYSSKVSGSGFGLPLAKLAAQKVQGELSMTPHPGEGTELAVKLPLVK